MSWPHDVQIDVRSYFQPMIPRDGFLLEDPIVIPTVAEHVHTRSSDSHDGVYKPSTGEIHGSVLPKRQDTYITGTAGRTGREFTAVHGTWKDFQTDYSGVFGITMQDNTKEIPYEILSVTTTSKIENCQMFIGRGALPPVAADYQFNSSNTYLYIYLSWGSQVDFRIALEYRKPMRIDRTQDGWATIEKAASSAGNADTERFFSTSRHKLPIDVFADYDNNQIVVALGDGKELCTAVYQQPVWQAGVDRKLLPQAGRIRLVGQNGNCSFEYYPKRYQPLKAKIRKDIGHENHSRSSEAAVVVNSRDIANPTHSVNYSTSTDGQIHTVDLQITQPDAGDGQGSSDPSTLVDATMIIPPTWTFSTFGLNNEQSFYGRNIRVEYWQEFDDNINMFSSGGNLILENYDGFYTGLTGNMAIDIWGSAGDAYYQLFKGIAGDGPGVKMFQVDTLGRISCPIHDFSKKMKNPIGQRLLLDRMCLYNAIHLVATLCGIHPQYLWRLPLYIPPNCTLEAPYGPAGIDCPYPVLSSGSGMHARHDYGPEMLGWEIFQLLIADQGLANPITGQSVPFYGGFLLDGTIVCEAFNPSTLVPVVFFQEIDTSGLAQIQHSEFCISTEQMRTSVDFIGLQPWTNQLQHKHIDQPINIKQQVGYPKRWTERGARYSDEYLNNAANTAASMSSIPEITGSIVNTWIPYVTAGQRCLVYDSKSLTDVLDAYIRRIDVSLGNSDLTGRDGHVDAQAVYSVRAIANTARLF